MVNSNAKKISKKEATAIFNKMDLTKYYANGFEYGPEADGTSAIKDFLQQNNFQLSDLDFDVKKLILEIFTECYRAEMSDSCADF